MTICYTVPEKWLMTDVILFVHFGLFFALLPPTAQKIKIKKNLHMCTRNYDQMMYSYQNMVHDGRIEKVTYRGRRPT